MYSCLKDVGLAVLDELEHVRTDVDDGVGLGAVRLLRDHRRSVALARLHRTH